MTLAIPSRRTAGPARDTGCATEPGTDGAAGTPAVPPVVGARLAVPLVDGRRVTYANLDHAASTPALEAVRDAVDELLPWYASVHRGAGFASQVCTRVYDQARDVLRRFVGAHGTDEVVFTRNTTDSLNLLAGVLPRGTSVVLFDTEHHAALLPWRGPRVHRLRTPESAGDAVLALDRALADCAVGPRLVVLTAASNVTGEVWPIAELSAVARRHGARVALDAAQLAPHRPVDIRALDVDWVALSGHKLYAPFGAGALVGRADWLKAAEPHLVGGGATASVTDRGDRLAVTWSTGPERHEAGSPNVVGVHALATACEAITRHGWDAVVEHERVLLHRLRAGLATVPGLRPLGLFGPAHDRVGVVSFTVDGLDSGLAAAALSAEHGIGVRDGAFCAHVATARLLDRAGSHERRALRVSIGLGTTPEHVDRLVAALHALVDGGPAAEYALVDGRWAPVEDPRPLPPFLRELP
ncbi:aminotransferase class V-fold PLP-dependent enzyme [Actinokineospora sp. PR83]|uniref:aminotransferase class V-fold PLP-dependent enzyme n=1 Tax=Actinokineospora sp. PR83 TaxID=2884908 RepID=UPI001F224187|nr:aminotransferase class V-fold PLP-dependent enzyme [Actinokineospora sp. PR83]MCG8914632.1 aminotransferase class V-fold PLP-dependent enzyme [Actinokineospora sp. PR83]